MKYRIFLFDFDGTLVDSMPTYISVMLRILDENNIPYAPDIMKIITPLGYGGSAKYFIGMGLDKPEEEIVKQMHAYACDEYALRIPAKNNVIRVLKELKAMGCSLNVLTASPHEALDPCLKRLGVYELFDHVWSCEDFHTTKADPDIYVRAAKEIGVPVEKILFLDDNYNADRCARESGIGVCGVFDPSSEEFEEEIRSVSHFYIRDFDELIPAMTDEE